MDYPPEVTGEYPTNSDYSGSSGYPPAGYPAGNGYSAGGYPAGGYPAEAYPPAPGYGPGHPTAPGFAGSGYAAPGYEAPGYAAPGYGPDYAGPGYPAPDYAGTGYPGAAQYPAEPGYPVEPGYPPAGYPPGYPPTGVHPHHHPTSGFAAYPESGPSPGRYPDVGATGYGDDHPTTSFRSVEPAGDPAFAPGPLRRPAETRPAAPADARARRKRKGLPLWQELPLLLVIALCLAVLVRTFLLQAFYIPSGSMEDTLVAGDRVLVNKVVYNFREPARGEVVVFEGTDAWAPVAADDEDIGTFAKVGRAVGDLVGVSRPGAKDYIKRVVGLPGDTVSCCDVEGRVFVNGQPLEEDYVIRDSPLDDAPQGDCRGRRFDEVVVQPGHMFVMGDHRQVSQDSRCQGQVPLDNVIGRAFVIVWPSDRWHGLSQPETFDTVPPASVSAAAPIGPTGPLELALTLPLVMALRAPFRGNSASFRLIGRLLRRRLAT